MAEFFAELKRRHMFRVAATYAVVAWLILQVVNNIAPGLNLPNWVLTVVIVLLAAGFPIALIFAWIHQLTPADASAPRTAATRLDYTLIGALVLVIALVFYQQLAPSSGTTTPQAKQADVSSLTAPGPAGISIAVLPFANVSGDATQEFFSDGMSDEIMTALAKIPSLQVVARASAFQFKGQSRDISAISQALHARYVIDGSVRRAGNRVRIAAQLIQADNGVNIWADSFDRELTDVFAIQEDIAQAIAGALRVPLGLAQGETLVSNRTDDLDSYQQYLQARSLIRARALGEAIALLEPVVARNPRYAPAWGLLARAYGLAPTFGPELRSGSLESARAFVQTSMDKGEKAAAQAIQLDSRNAFAYAALTYIEGARGKWLAAEDHIRQALALDPNDPEVQQVYGTYLATVGRFGDSSTIRERLRTLEPFVPIYNVNTAEIMQYNGQSLASIPALEAIPANAAGGLFRSVYLAHAYAAAGRYAEAADALLTITGELVNRQSIETAAQLLRQAPSTVTSSVPTLQGELNFVYAFIGVPSRVLDYPERLIDLHYADWPGLRSVWSQELTSVRKTERFKALMRNAGLVDYWRERGWPDLCRPAGTDDFVCD